MIRNRHPSYAWYFVVVVVRSLGRNGFCLPQMIMLLFARPCVDPLMSPAEWLAGFSTLVVSMRK